MWQALGLVEAEATGWQRGMGGAGGAAESRGTWERAVGEGPGK